MRLAMPLEGLSLVEVVGANAPAALSLAMGMCGRIANDLGATVTRIVANTSEPIDMPSDIFLNSGKQCLSVSGDRIGELASSLIGAADCMVADATTIAEFSPEVSIAVMIAVAMTAEDPAQGSEFTVEAESGLLDLIGDPERSPLRLGGHQVAYAAGLSAYLAMISGLTEKVEGKSLPVRNVSLLDVAVWLNWKTLAVASRTGIAPTRKGPAAEWTSLKCRDGYFAAVYRTRDWETLKKLFNDPRLDDPRIQTAEGRRTFGGEVNALLGTLFRDLSRAEIHQLSLANKLPLGPVWAPGELRGSPHLCERKFLTTVETVDGEAVLPTLPVKWTGRTFSPTGVVSPATD